VLIIQMLDTAAPADRHCPETRSLCISVGAK